MTNPIRWARLPGAARVAAALVWLCAGLAAPGPPATSRDAPEPILTLAPSRGPCAGPNQVITARGSGFPPGATINLTVRRQFSHVALTDAPVMVNADGSFAAPARLFECDADTPPGTLFGVVATQGDPKRGGGEGVFLARATFTTLESPGGPLCFAATGRCVRGRFLDRWIATGGLYGNGQALSEEFVERLEDGHEYTVQYFELTRLEYHPENRPPHDILLGQFGRRVRPADPPVAALPDATHFAETGHNLSGDFLLYWQHNGALAQFGLPISEPFDERLEDGKTYRVQYFERARFEYHPEAFEIPVRIGEFGRRILAGPGK